MSDYSQFGYWFSPQGEVFALDVPQSHSMVISELNVFDLPGASKLEISQHAVEQGWIAVSISPVGDSIGIRVRDHLPEKGALMIMKSILKDDGHFDTLVHTDLDNGTVKEVIERLQKNERDSMTYPNIQDEIAFHVRSVERRRALLRWYDFVASRFDIQKVHLDGLHAALTDIKKLLSDAQEIILDSSVRRGASVDEFMSIVNETGQKLTSYGEQIAAAINDAFNRSLGFDDWQPWGDLPEYNLSGSSEDQLIAIKKLRDETAVDQAVLDKHKQVIVPIAPLVQAINSASSFATSLGSNMRVMMKALEKARVEGDALKRMHGTADYYIGHECSAALYILDTALGKVEAAMAVVASNLEAASV